MKIVITVFVRRCSIALVLCFVTNSLSAGSLEEAWFNDDWEERAENVNEGELEILDILPEKPVHFHFNKLTITAESINTGWVQLYQCHEHLDAVHALQIVYNKESIKDLSIAYTKNIKKSWVQDSSVQLEDIEHHSKICIQAKTKALEVKNNKGVLRNGPFMRRFLDGFYPMHVRVEVDYPADQMTYKTSSPVSAVAGKNSDMVTMDIWFSGKLRTEILFDLKN